jgi:hypothetical protein
MPRCLSVVMPVYNGARFLREAIDSVLDQTERDFELVVVDDGSSDGTPGILASYDDPRIRVVRTPHAGLIAALNTGMSRADSRYIARMDADDRCHPERFARQLACFGRDPDVAVVTCACERIDAAGRITGRTAGGVAADMLLELAAGNGIVHGSVMLRRDALPPGDVYSRAPEDYELWVRLVRAGARFHAVPEPLYAFRTHRARYSLVHAERQSRAITEVQWPLVEECSATRDPAHSRVRSRLLRGWGTVGGAAYRSGQAERGCEAAGRFRRLVPARPNDEIMSAISDGAEALIWGGCPTHERLALRWLELRLRPRRWSSYRKLIVSLLRPGGGA